MSLINHGPIKLGKSLRLCNIDSDSAGSDVIEFQIDSDSVLVSLFVGSTSGSVNVSVDTYAGEHATEVIAFPEITGPLTEILLRKSAVAMSNLRLKVDYTGPSVIEVYVKGIGAGETSVKIIGSNKARASQIDITDTPTKVVATSLDDRQGLMFRNLGPETIYVGFTIAETTVDNGYPVLSGEAFQSDIQAGSDIYAVTASGVADVRIVESGE